MTPKKIALLTDSSADLRWDQARENNIFFVPLRILCEDGEYLDGVNITGPDIYQRLHNGELPQTSLPRVEDFSAKLREIFDLGYDGVIAVMLSSGLSGTYNLARILAGECAEQGYAMKVFDSVSGALGQGMTVLQLAEDIKNGMDWEELTERPGSAAHRQHLSLLFCGYAGVSGEGRPDRQGHGYGRHHAPDQAHHHLCAGRTAAICGQGPGTASGDAEAGGYGCGPLRRTQAVQSGGGSWRRTRKKWRPCGRC